MPSQTLTFVISVCFGASCACADVAKPRIAATVRIEIAAIPYGGGSSVVGGVEADIPERYRGAVSIDLGGLNQ